MSTITNGFIELLKTHKSDYHMYKFSNNLNIPNSSWVKECHLLTQSVPEKISFHPELRDIWVLIDVVDQPGQPALLQDWVHEDVARVQDGGAELCQQKTAEYFRGQLIISIYLMIRIVLALVSSTQVRRFDWQRKVGKASSWRLESVVEWRLVRACPVCLSEMTEKVRVLQKPVSISE